MVDVAMAEEDVRVEACARPDERIPERAQPAAGVEDHEPGAAADFHAGRIAPIAHSLVAGAGDAATNPPEPNANVSHSTLTTITPLR